MHLALGRIDGIIGHLTASDGVVKVEFTHHLTQGLDSDSTLRDGQRVSARGGNSLGNVHIHLVVQESHRRFIGCVRRGIGQHSHDVMGQAVNLHREGDGEMLQALYDALGGINGNLVIERGANITRDGKIETEFMHLLAQGLDDDGTSGDGERVFTRIGNLIGEVHQGGETHLGNLGHMGGIGRVVSYRGFMAIGDLGHILGERDGEKLQARHFALGGINGNLLIKRVGSTANGEP